MYIKSHLQMFHDTIIDVRHVYSSEYILSNPHALTPQVVDKFCESFEHDVKAGEIRADFCKSDHVEGCIENRENHKTVRFCNDNDDDDNIDGNGGTNGMGRPRGVRRQCKSNRGFRSRCKSNANVLTTTHTVSVNDDMTTTENDHMTTTDSTTSHDTSHGLGNTLSPATNRRAIQDPKGHPPKWGCPSRCRDRFPCRPASQWRATY